MALEPSQTTQATDSDAWLAFLNNEINQYKGDPDREVPELFKELFTAADANQLVLENFVRRLAELYHKSTLRCEPLDTLLDLARILPYTDSKQGILLELLKDLMKHPDAEEACSTQQRSNKIETLRFNVFKQEGYEERLSEFLHGGWNGFYRTQGAAPSSARREPVPKQCEEWVSFSVFKARTLAAGICAKKPEDFKAPHRDIPIGLRLASDLDQVAGTAHGYLLRDCKLMVSAQFILIAGEVIKADIDADSFKGWNDESWRTWAMRFLEATSWDNLQETTKTASKGAYYKMKGLWPDLFINENNTASTEVGNAVTETEQSS